MSRRIERTKSSGNVFADLGLSNPEERMLEAELAIQIRRIIEQKGWTGIKCQRSFTGPIARNGRVVVWTVEADSRA